MLALVREHPDAVEADLARFYGIDYRDRWHPDRRRRLTLRRIAVLCWRWPPTDSNVIRVANGGHQPWQLEHALLDDLRLTVLATTEGIKRAQIKPHPDREAARKRAQRARSEQRRQMTPERRRRFIDAQARARARRRAIEAGDIT